MSDQWKGKGNNMKTDYKGIDYGLGKTNIDTENGIRYGVISIHEVMQAWCDSSEPEYDRENCMLAQGYPDCEAAECEPVSFTYESKEYIAFSDSQGDIFITKSPFYTFAQFCSPCAPGACHLDNPIEHVNPNYPYDLRDNNKCYCFGHDWFDSGKAPYTVYDVRTGKEVKHV